MKSKMILIISFAALSTYSTAHAEPLYISDKLVVNVYAEANPDSSKVATLDSGDALDAIEKVESYTHVRLADNREGWIKSSYLTAQAPAIVRLKELEKERGNSTAVPSAQSINEIKQLKERNAALQSEISVLKQAAARPTSQIAAAPATKVATPVSQGRLKVEPIPRDEELPLSTEHLRWGAALVAVSGAISFMLGYQTLARRIRRKYGSVKIY